MSRLPGKAGQVKQIEKNDEKKIDNEIRLITVL
jgi:hypothetical protein